MVKNIEDMQQFGKDNMDATMKSFGSLSKSMQAIAVEVADYSKKMFENSTAATEKLIGANAPIVVFPLIPGGDPNPEALEKRVASVPGVQATASKLPRSNRVHEKPPSVEMSLPVRPTASAVPAVPGTKVAPER